MKGFFLKRAEMQIAPVPAHYRGVWQRSLLEAPQLHDVDTTVFWLQTGRWHADIRLPAGRPDFSGIREFSDCNEQQLDWLVRQHGFAGVTQVEKKGSREICRWHRVLDYQPARLEPDAGVMQFEPALLKETGLYSPYLEHWHLLPDSLDGFAALQLLDTNGMLATPAQFILIAGAYVMYVRNRAIDWPAELIPGTLLTTGVVAKYVALLDFELSFGRRTANGWQILHSTLPWRTGQSVSVQLLATVQHDQVAMNVDGEVQNWKCIEWTPPLRNSD